MKTITTMLGAAMVAGAVTLSPGAAASAAPTHPGQINGPNPHYSYVLGPTGKPYGWTYYLRPRRFHVTVGPTIKLTRIHWRIWHPSYAIGRGTIRVCDTRCGSLGRHTFLLYRRRLAPVSGTLHYFKRLRIYTNGAPIAGRLHWSWSVDEWVQGF